MKGTEAVHTILQTCASQARLTAVAAYIATCMYSYLEFVFIFQYC